MVYIPFRSLALITTTTPPTIITKITAETKPPISPLLMLSHDDEFLEYTSCSLACIMFCSVSDTNNIPTRSIYSTLLFYAMFKNCIYA